MRCWPSRSSGIRNNRRGAETLRFEARKFFSASLRLGGEFFISTWPCYRYNSPVGQHEGQGFTDIAFPDIVSEPLDGSRPFAVSAQATILRYFKELLDARPGVRANEDIEAVHEIRVAARRTRTALQTFAALWSESQCRRWLDYLAKLADTFTIARDTDVLIEYLTKQLKSAEGQRAIAMSWLLERARQRREEEQPGLEKLLRRSEKDGSAQEFVKFFSTTPVDLWLLNKPAMPEALPLPEPDETPDSEPEPSDAQLEAIEAGEAAGESDNTPGASSGTAEEPNAPESAQDTDQPQEEGGSPSDVLLRAVELYAQRQTSTEPHEHMETPAAPAQIPEQFSAMAHDVLEELSPVHESEAAFSVEAARFRGKEDEHGAG